MPRWRRSDVRGLAIIWYRDVLRFWRDRWRIASSLMQPSLYLFIFGSGLATTLGGARRDAGGVSDYVLFLFPGVIAMTILFTAVFSALSTVWDREFGFLKEVLVAPVSREAVAVGKTLGGSTQALFQGGIVLLLAPLVGVPLTPLLVAQVLPLMFLLAFALSALGLAVASRIETIQGFHGVVNFLILPMFFLSGAVFPLQGAPAWIGTLALLDPVTYGVDPLRRVILAASGVPVGAGAVGIEVLGRPLSVAEEIAVLVVFAVVMLALAARRFGASD